MLSNLLTVSCSEISHIKVKFVISFKKEGTNCIMFYLVLLIVAPKQRNSHLPPAKNVVNVVLQTGFTYIISLF